MKKHHKYFNILLLSITILTILSCKKQSEWLEVKSNKNTVVPETLADFQAILDNTTIINTAYSNAGIISSDNLILSDAAYDSANEETRNLYKWNKQVWTGVGVWSSPFKCISLANIVLEGMQKLNTTSQQSDNIKGQALFQRSISYYTLVQKFCKAYQSSAATDLGLPLRQSADVGTTQQRSSLSDTYQFMLKDAIAASQLLAANQPYTTRPAKAAAFALLAKIYLNMEDYKNALTSAQICLDLNPELLDYNNSVIANLSSTYRFPALGKDIPEILYYAQGNSTSAATPSTSAAGNVDPELYDSYQVKDLRKALFFALSGSSAKNRGSYTGGATNFCGLATNEVYLIRAECNARLGNTETAISDLNTLLRKRYLTGQFTDYQPTTPEAALELTLKERRKELPFVGDLRWEDLKRLNKESRFQKTLIRTIHTVESRLEPNSDRYALPIPDAEVQLTGIQQNQR